MSDSTIDGVDVTTLTDSDLAALNAATSSETVRRSNLATIPQQVTSLTTVFLAAGGDLAAITAAVNAAAPPTQQ